MLYLERQKIIDAVQTDTFDGLFALYHLLLDKEKSDLRNYSHQHHQVRLRVVLADAICLSQRSMTHSPTFSIQQRIIFIHQSINMDIQ